MEQNAAPNSTTGFQGSQFLFSPLLQIQSTHLITRSWLSTSPFKSESHIFVTAIHESHDISISQKRIVTNDESGFYKAITYSNRHLFLVEFYLPHGLDKIVLCPHIVPVYRRPEVLEEMLRIVKLGMVWNGCSDLLVLLIDENHRHRLQLHVINDSRLTYA